METEDIGSQFFGRKAKPKKNTHRLVEPAFLSEIQQSQREKNQNSVDL